jgi:aldehyde dehydrogenase (NAD+)
MKHQENAFLKHFDAVQPCRSLCGSTALGDGNGTMLHHSPIDGALLPAVFATARGDYIKAVDDLHAAFTILRTIPAPRRGQLIKAFGEAITEHKTSLAELITLEAGKIGSEALGEVQEVIDICDFAVGLSRQLHGLTIVSERKNHRMMEQWHPLGVVGVITAFNFPMAVWAWNACIALVCGNTVLWKPSEQTPLCAIALHKLMQQVLQQFPDFPAAVVGVVCGNRDVGQWIARDRRIALVSATGSTAMGRDVAATVAQRLGKSLLELGGNNALICAPSADLDLALRAIVFAAVGTCGQRCTSLRRLIIHNSIRAAFVQKLASAFASVRIGDPRDAKTLVGPLISAAAFNRMQTALQSAGRQGAKVISGGERIFPLASTTKLDSGYYVMPALVEATADCAVMFEETFAPILYVVGYDALDEAIAINNAVSQGLSSAIFTRDLQEAERFLSAGGSDCGIANVNVATSGAEIGGAFGGEKDTGGGRESGSDAWKSYMRRTTNTINYGNDMPLAQGVVFDV